MTLLEMLTHPELLIYFKHLALSYLWLCRKTKFILLFWARAFFKIKAHLHLYYFLFACLVFKF